MPTAGEEADSPNRTCGSVSARELGFQPIQRSRPEGQKRPPIKPLTQIGATPEAPPPWVEKLLLQQAGLLSDLHMLVKNQASAFRQMELQLDERLAPLGELPELASTVAGLQARVDEIGDHQLRNRSPGACTMCRASSAGGLVSGFGTAATRRSSPEPVATESNMSTPNSHISRSPSPGGAVSSDVLAVSPNANRDDTWALIEGDDEMRSMLKDVRRQVEIFAERNDRDNARKVTTRDFRLPYLILPSIEPFHVYLLSFLCVRVVALILSAPIGRAGIASCGR